MAVHAFLATALVAGASAAEASPAGDVSGYLTSTDATTITDSFGECWHTGEWKPGMHFGGCDPQPVRAAAAPQVAKPALKAPEKAPVAVATKPAPKPVPFRISTDTLFDFDSAILKPEGRTQLDNLESQITHANYRSVAITGHTDRIGSPSYNRHLSERRAQAVRDYLAAQGLDSRKITTRGVGSSEPELAADKCHGLRGTRFIECLQPERYAEVVVLGSAPQKSAMR